MKKLKYHLEGNITLYLLMSLILAGFYMFERHAKLPQLIFILKPVVWIVEKALGLPFQYNPESGFINESIGIVINKSCAGVKFWMMAFGMIGFSFLSKLKNSVQKFNGILGCLLFTYGLTFLANSSRIVIAIGLLQLKLSRNVVLERLFHQMAGVLVYCTYLWVTYIIVSKWMERMGGYNEEAL